MQLASHPPESEPTPSAIADAAETKWMLRTGIGLAASSIVGLLLLTVGLLVLSGLVTVPTVAGSLATGLGFVVLAFVLLVLAFPTEDDANE